MVTTDEQDTREGQSSLESIALDLDRVKSVVVGLYDHVGSLIDQCSDIYQILADRAAFSPAYGADYDSAFLEGE